MPVDMTAHDSKLESSFHMALLGGFAFPLRALLKVNNRCETVIRQALSLVWFSLSSNIDHLTKSGFRVKVKARIEVNP